MRDVLRSGPRSIFAVVLLLAVTGLVLGCGDDSASTTTAQKPKAQPPVPETPADPAPDTTKPETPTIPAAPDSTKTPAASAPKGGKTERWYEIAISGRKTGYFQVLWAPSTWKGKPTLHDTTTHTSKHVRDMAGIKDVFESTHTTDIERADDGSLWWRKDRVEEAGRITTSELTWNGSGYDHIEQIVGQKPKTKTIAAQKPVMTDSESFLGHLHRQGKLKVGDTFDLPQLHVRAEKVIHTKLEVVAEEMINDEHGAEIKTLKVRETNPLAKTEGHMWLDSLGAFVMIKSEGGVTVRRVLASSARKMPTRPATMPITTPSSPALDRLFSADKHIVEIRLRAEEDRKAPEFPDSPWSRVLKKTGSDKDGWVFTVECSKYDSEAKTATIPITDEAFEDDLKATVLMQSEDPRVVRIAKQVVGDEKDARKAAYKLARYVTENLRKQSPPVAQASATQILDMGCGDCSEHCLLFVTLCRAAGIPARRCSGYVNIGQNWGGHAWCEIWTGQWIAADPTTGEVGGGARYVFFGYSDKPDSYPGVVSSRIRGRIRFVSQSVTEGEATYDLTDPNTFRRYDEENRRYLHVLCGLEAREVPGDWRVSLSGNNRMRITGSGMTAEIYAFADQGQTIENLTGRFGRGMVKTSFGGAPAVVRSGGSQRVYFISSRRRTVQLMVMGGDADTLAMLEKVLKPTFTPKPMPW